MISVDQQNFKVEKAATSKLKNAILEEFKFGKDFSDHMFTADFRQGKWDSGKIVPYGDISISPAMSSIHYGQAIFEGMKAYKSPDGKIRLFRPFENAKRFNISAKRLCMPEIDEDYFVSALKELVKLDSGWVSDKEGHSLYLRPFMFAEEAFLGVRPAVDHKFMIICSPASSYYSEPVKVKVESHYSRAAIGGVGFAKAAGNYAAAMYPTQLANKEGFHQLIWTDPVHHKFIEEAGTMNLVFVINGKLITPALDNQTILDGITRDSVLQIAKKLGYKIEEREVSVDEISEAYDNGNLTDAFGTGTAANIAHIRSITYKDKEMLLPPVTERQLSNKLSKYLSDLKSGRIEDEFGWVELL